MHLPALRMEQTHVRLAVRPDQPKPAIRILVDLLHVVEGKPVFFLGKQAEGITVEAVEPVGGAHPNKASAVLKDNVHLPVRQTFLHAKVLHLGDVLLCAHPNGQTRQKQADKKGSTQVKGH